MKILRIVFCILSCLCVAASVFIGVYYGLQWCLITLAGAILFGAGMFLAKNKSEPKQRSTDFMNSDAENEQIRKENEKE